MRNRPRSSGNGRYLKEDNRKITRQKETAPKKRPLRAARGNHRMTTAPAAAPGPTRTFRNGQHVVIEYGHGRDVSYLLCSAIPSKLRQCRLGIPYERFFFLPRSLRIPRKRSRLRDAHLMIGRSHFAWHTNVGQARQMVSRH